jgi:transcriptional regulator with XRE-family HTH domain
VVDQQLDLRLWTDDLDDGPERVVYYSGPLTWYAKNSGDRLDTVRKVASIVDESLGDHGFDVHVPHKRFRGRSSPGAYLENRLIIARSVLVIAFYDYPSTGLGQELEIAAEYMRPVILLVNERRDNVSTMVSRGFVHHEVLEYDDSEELRERLPAMALEVLGQSRDLGHASLCDQLGPTIRRHREVLGMSRGELAARAGCPEAVIRHLETDPAEVLSPTLVQLVRVSEALGLGADGLVAPEHTSASAFPERVVRFAAENDRSADAALRVLRLAARTDSTDDLTTERAIEELFDLVDEFDADPPSSP